MTPATWIFLLAYIIIAVVRQYRDTKAEKRNKELEKDIIDLRDRINRIEEYPMLKTWLDWKNEQSKRA